MPIAASVIARQKRHVLVEATVVAEPVIVPAEYLSIEIEAERLPPHILLDRRAMPIVLNDARTRGVCFLDAFRSVGFHCLQIENARFYFATEDAKLQLDGIRKI